VQSLAAASRLRVPLGSSGFYWSAAVNLIVMMSMTAKSDIMGICRSGSDLLLESSAVFRVGFRHAFPQAGPSERGVHSHVHIVE
jgi:hypothetical protein